MAMLGNGRIRGFFGGIALAWLAMQGRPEPIATQSEQAAPTLRQPEIYIETFVTGYNTVAAQTDDTPCIAASGANICGRSGTIACPPFLPFGAVVEVKGKRYVCEDRMARKYRTRFDVNCDKDRHCPYEVTGWTAVKLVLD
jgi:hypothetical protein